MDEPQLNIPVTPTAPAQNPNEQDIRTMRADLGTTTPAPNLPTFDGEEPAFTPETTTPGSQDSTVDQMLAAQKSNTLIWLVGGIIGFVVLAAVGYFVVYPLFNKASSPAPTPVVEQPVIAQPATPTSPAPVQPAAAKHLSQFINPPIATVNAQLPAALPGSTQLMEAMRGALVQQGQAALSGLTEVIVTTPTGPLSAQEFLYATAPSIDGYADSLETDFTAFIYKDTAGIWPGYVMQFKAGSAQSVIVTTAAILEKLALKNFFVVDPGVLAPFKGGTVNGIWDRYAVGKTAGASFGYLVKNNKLLISTSFAGMKEALRLMGL